MKVVLLITAFLFPIAIIKYIFKSNDVNELITSDTILSTSELNSHAKSIGENHAIFKSSIGYKFLFKRLDRNYKYIYEVYKTLGSSVKDTVFIGSASEWLLDNFYIIEEHVKKIQQNMNKKFINNLNVLKDGYLKGYPRIFSICLEFVSHTDGIVIQKDLVEFIKSYQSKNILTISEIWAIQIMIKIALIEKIRHTCEKIHKTHLKWKEVESLKNKDTDYIISIIENKINSMEEIDYTYIEHLLLMLKNRENGKNEIAEFINKSLSHFDIDVQKIISMEHEEQASAQITMGNCINSLRVTARIDWNKLFESLSYVEKILETDPSEKYSMQDLKTRELYRNAIQKISKDISIPETKIASTAINCCNKYNDENENSPSNHVGYYIIGKGRRKLFLELGINNNHYDRKISINMYIVLNALLTLLIIFPICIYSYNKSNFNVLTLLITALISLIPASDISINFVNWLITHIMPANSLPKLEYKEGVPEECKTIIIVPTLLSNKKRVFKLLEQLEVSYLGNNDKNIYFVLLGDLKDSETESMDNDNEIITTALDGIKKLNLKYGYEDNKFYFLGRHRTFSKTQNKFMGWERKRGAIVEFNSLLREDNNTTYSFISSDISPLLKSKYVITLDADTFIPIDTAKKLIGTISHPLNKAILDYKNFVVSDGYGLIQPRIGINVESANKSFFSRIFGGHGGIDPYSTASSDIYQDMFCEGIFTGKGIYDIDAFNITLKDSIPENKVLSHDLIEGSYLRVGLASDIELIDGYPENFSSYMMRLHRWTRGDWQISGWLFNNIKNSENKKIPNPINKLSKWKIFDNLRRSIVSSALCLFLLISILFLPGKKYAYILFFAACAFYPILLGIVDYLILKYYKAPRERLNGNLVYGLKAIFISSILNLAFLSYHSFVMLDSIIRSIYRMNFSKKNLLSWITAADAEAFTNNTLKGYMKSMKVVFYKSAIFIVLTSLFAPDYISYSLLLLIPFILSPYIAYKISQETKYESYQLSEDELKNLRTISLKTWEFYRDFTCSDENYLPPDNFQIEPVTRIAHRTSPTNIGFLLISTLSARDFGYITTSEMLEMLSSTISTIEKMDKWNGHLYNWYDTKTLEVLNPKYISTVDSGNLVGYLIVLSKGINEYMNKSLFDNEFFYGIYDHGVLCESNEICSIIDKIDLRKKYSFSELMDYLNTIKLKCDLNERWKRNLNRLIESIENELKNLFPKILFSKKREEIIKLNFPELIKQELIKIHTSSSLIELLEIYNNIIDFQTENTNESILNFINDIKFALRNVENKIDAGNKLVKTVDKLQSNMKFAPLYDNKRNLFSIGYNIDEDRLTNSYYDLLASECRLTSYIATSRREIPPIHWFRLGRSLTSIDGYRSLVSWTGTMFEYFMPALVMRNYKNTLMDETYSTAVKAQIKYGKYRNVPWGTSESGFYLFDLLLNYQYKAFGVPELGLKRGLINDMVVSPYSTVLALPYSPRDAMNNINTLLSKEFNGEYGFYEAIDYTPSRIPDNNKFAIVESFMAHHQGMILIALNNYLNNNIMINRFHSNPQMKCGEYLLQEKIPLRVIITKEHKEEITPLVNLNKNPIDIVRKYELDDLYFPSCHILSNGNYSVILDNSGCGYSKYNDINITRWREELTPNYYGTFFFIKNINTNSIWSSTISPLRNNIPDEYTVNFYPDRAEFLRIDDTLETHVKVCVSPEDNCEIRKIIFVNHSNETILVECTSYCETVLAPHSADIAHPAFSNLFIRTEYISEYKSIISSRRPRNTEKNDVFAFHCLAIEDEFSYETEYETDRYKFIGRGNNINNPDSLTHPLTNYTGPVLDPIMSIRQKISVPPLKSVHISYTTGYAENRENAIELSARYSEPSNITRSFELSYIRSNMEYNYVGLDEKEVKLFDNMLPHIIYPSPIRQRYEEKLKLNTKGQSSLWQYGISGDIPIMLVTIKNMEDIDTIKLLLKAHEYFRLKGLKFDLVILNQDESSYLQPLQNLIRDTVLHGNSKYIIDTPGGIFIKDANNIPKDDINLLYSAARLIIDANEGIKSQIQINNKTINKNKLEFKPNHSSYTDIDNLIDVDFFNGYGGFSKDGKEYIIKLKNNLSTPLPWINVLSNDKFGCTVSESTLGYTWWKNSRENKITPWSNDPVSDTPGEVIYIRDDDYGYLFTPTPLPIRENNSYTITHGIGYSKFKHMSYGIDTNLTVFVPHDFNIKICILTVKNYDSKNRNLSLFHYIRPVMGVNTQDTQQFILSRFDEKSETVILTNPYNTDFSDGMVFTASNMKIHSYTCDRNEFIGFYGSLTLPNSINFDQLSNTCGTGFDPCIAMQYKLSINPNDEKKIIFLLGESNDINEIYYLKEIFSNIEYCESSLKKSIDYWRDITDCVQIDTPDKSANILMNSWLIYQTLSCRIWARSAFYQSGGAFGFRDQLQDVMSILYSKPEIAKKQILLHCAHQFVEGDVQHWWHPYSNDKGIRTKFSDDLVWLPYVTAEYIEKTGDSSILEEEVGYIEDLPLDDNVDERYGIPKKSEYKSTVYEHCIRAIEKSLKFGEHGIPLMGSGDWNDGMSTVGNKGKGESVWLGWFIYSTLVKFSSICELRGDTEIQKKYEIYAKNIVDSIEKNAWDGEWYRRAYFDDGTPLGSSSNSECKIDSIAQSWSVISEGGNRDRANISMQSVLNYLVDKQNGLIMLFTPPFDNGNLHPGYIRGYVPGVRENGGQYTHASTWVIYAFAKLGYGDTAEELYKLINPINHTLTNLECARYKVEPYVMSADVYTVHPYTGRGGWTWYTGSSAWMYKVFLEQILGFNKNGDKLIINPCIPSDWKEYSIHYKYMDTMYEILVKNISRKCTGVSKIILDGNEVNNIRLVNDTLKHSIEITM